MLKSIKFGINEDELVFKEGINHVTSSNYAQIADPLVNIFLSGNKKISLNLLKFYNDIAASSQDALYLPGLTINQTYLITGDYSGPFAVGSNNDLVILINDSINIFNQIQSNTEGALTVSGLSGLHPNLPDVQNVKQYIRGVL